MKFTFGQVFVIALCGAAFALTGAWLAVRRAPWAYAVGVQTTAVLSDCRRISQQSNEIICYASLPVYVYRAPQTETPAVAAAGVW